MSKEELLEGLENVQYRMHAETFHYCFDGYSSFEEVKDEEFHRLRKDYLLSAERLQNYVNNKIDELNQKKDE